MTTAPTASRPTLYHLQKPEIIANPWPWYNTLRAQGPVIRDPCTSSWLVTRHADVIAILANRQDFGVFMNHQQRAEHAPPAAARALFYLDNIVSFIDAPDHTRHRKVLAARFTPSHADRLNDYIAGLVATALDRTAGPGRMDVVSDLAARIPLQVIAHLLGSDVNLDILRRWSAAWGTVVAAPGHILTGADTDTVLAEGDELIDHLTALVAAHRDRPRDTVTGALVDAADAGDLSEAELIGNLMLLLTAGNETTASLIANAVAALMTHPGLVAQLSAAPTLLPAAVDEVSRLHPSTQYTARIARTDMTLHGQRIRAGHSVVLMLACANRDPQAFDDPDTLRLDRPATPRPVSFGHGPHYCFGAPLARLETRHVLTGVLARCTNLHPDGPAPWRDNPNLRCLAALPVTFRPRPHREPEQETR